MNNEASTATADITKNFNEANQPSMSLGSSAQNINFNQEKAKEGAATGMLKEENQEELSREQIDARINDIQYQIEQMEESQKAGEYNIPDLQEYIDILKEQYYKGKTLTKADMNVLEKLANEQRNQYIKENNLDKDFEKERDILIQKINEYKGMKNYESRTDEQIREDKLLEEQREREDTAVQRSAKDIQQAGLHKGLMFGNIGGAGSAGGGGGGDSKEEQKRKRKKEKEEERLRKLQFELEKRKHEEKLQQEQEKMQMQLLTGLLGMTAYTGLGAANIKSKSKKK